MSRLLAAIVLISSTACTPALATAEVESVPPEPTRPTPIRVPPTDIEKAGLVDVVTNAESARGEPDIDVEFQERSLFGCKMHIWRDGVVAFEKRSEKKIGWSHVRPSDVAHWLSEAETIVPTKTEKIGRSGSTQRCGRRRFRYYTQRSSSATFRLADRRTVTVAANDPCQPERVDTMFDAISSAAPLPE